MCLLSCYTGVISTDSPRGVCEFILNKNIMIVKIVNRAWIELETTLEIAEGMIRKGEITTYETIDGEKVSWKADPIDVPLIKPTNITRKPKL